MENTDIKNEILNASIEHPPGKKNLFHNHIPIPVIFILLIISFFGGLLLAFNYFQNQVKTLNNEINAGKQTNSSKKILKIIIGTDATDFPMEYVNKQGSITGFDVDLGYRIAYEIGAKAEFENISWDNVFPDLQHKKIDMIISSVTITDQRKQLYDFSNPYINSGQIIISRTNNPITNLKELKGKKIAVETGTTNQQEALKYTSPNLVMGYNNLIQAAKDLSDGKADAMICDLTLAKGLINDYSNLKVTSEPFTDEYYGIVFRKDEQNLEDKVNKALTILQVNGYLSDLKQEWIE